MNIYVIGEDDELSQLELSRLCEHVDLGKNEAG